MLGEITDATVLSASEDNLNDVPITERPLNAYSRQIELKKRIHPFSQCVSLFSEVKNQNDLQRNGN